MNPIIEQSSFRDKDGFIFYEDGFIYRAINNSYATTWESLIGTRFFNELIKEGQLVSFEEKQVSDFDLGRDEIYKILKVQEIPFISYPNEWTFNQFRKAALLTLSIQKKALSENFILKDASAFNVQFIGSRAVFIDTLSFERYTDGSPWRAYKQFCQHFLSPLLLLSYGFNDLPSLFIHNIDGFPLKLVSRLLPFRSRFNLLTYTHIHLHARFEQKHSSKKEIKPSAITISKNRSMAIIEHLEEGIKKLTVKIKATHWTGYYDSFSYTPEGFESKKQFITKHMPALKGGLCADLGANTGEFSELASAYFNSVVACDSDPEVIAAMQAKKVPNILALHVDLVSPTPSFGWNCSERSSFPERLKKAELIMALALIHHLCIGNNLPLKKVAEFFSNLAEHLIIEFVPKTDEQVKKLLVTKQDIFYDYTLDNFKTSFGNYFHVVDEQAVAGSERVLFLLKKR